MWLKHNRFSVTRPDPISIVKQNSVKMPSDSTSHLRLKESSAPSLQGSTKTLASHSMGGILQQLLLLTRNQDKFWEKPLESK